MLKLNQRIVNGTTCLRCKKIEPPPKGGYKGGAACTVDEKQAHWHANTGYCPAGYFPFTGMGSVVTWLLWRLRIPQAMQKLRLFDFKKCKCQKRQAWLDRLGKWLFRRGKAKSE